MTVESNDPIAARSGWDKYLALIFKPVRSKTTTNRTSCVRGFSRA